MLPNERKEKYISDYGLSDYDAKILIKEKKIADYFEKCIEIGIDSKTAANWITVQIMGYINKNNLNINDIYLTPELLKQLVDNITNGTISSKQAKDIFFKVLEEEKEPKEFISKDNAQISDKDELGKIIDEILSNNTSQVEQYKSGKDNLFDYFVGQVMKNTRGKANPVITKELLKEKLS